MGLETTIFRRATGRDQLKDIGRGNWIAIGVCGIILGLLGMRYTKRRVARIERARQATS